MHRKLLNLLRANAKKGEFRAESGDQGNLIYVYDVIVASDEDAMWFGGVSAESFVKELSQMSGDVDIRVNSPGGDVFGGKAMATAMREYAGGTITTHVDGYAASAASHLVTNAAKAVMSPGSMLMIHKAWTLEIGNADDFRKSAEILDKIDGTIAADYAASAQRRGKAVADFAAMMADETWFTPEEAIAAGLADEVASAGPKNKLEWDLSAYDHAPKAANGTTIAKLEIDVSAVRAAIEEGIAQLRAEMGLKASEEITETGLQRPDSSDLLLRPAA